MAIRNRARPVQKKIKRLQQFGGLDLSSTFSQIDDNRFTDLQNMVLDDRGAIDKRFGYKEYLDKSSVAGKVNGIFKFNKISGSEILFVFGKEIWKQVGATLTGPLYTFTNELKVRGFAFNDKFYFLNGEEYVEYDGTDAKLVSEIAYVPTVTINAPPAGGGTSFEQTNMMTPKFKQTWVADGAASLFQFDGLDDSGTPIPLDAAEVVVTINLSTTLVETVDFTVNRTNATIDFSGGSAPYGVPTDEDLVEAQAERTEAGNTEKINKMTIFHVFGGANDTRVFLAGNSDIPNVDYRSGIDDATYIPVNNFDAVGDKSDPILGYATQYTTQVVFKHREIYVAALEYDSTTGIFLLKRKPVTYNVLFSATDSIEIIDNSPTFVTEKGIYKYVGGTGVKDERNIKHISDRIDRNFDIIGRQGILQSGELDKYIAIDYDQKYMLFNPELEIAWVYDYRYLDNKGVGEWFIWTNMPFNCVKLIDGLIYLGSKTDNKVYVFDNQLYNDNEAAIDAYMDTKLFTFDTYTSLKLIDKIFYTLKSEVSTSATLFIRTDVNDNLFSEIETGSASLLTYGESFTYGEDFTYGANIFPIVITEKIRIKKANFLQVRLKNDVLDEKMGIISIDLKFNYQREVK